MVQQIVTSVRCLRRDTSDRSPVVDLLFASSGIEPEVVTDAEPIDLLPNLGDRRERPDQ